MTTPATPPDDDAIERLLAGDALARRGEHVDDAGFTARVMAALPAPIALPRWRKPVEWLLAGTAGLALAASFPAVATDVAREMFRMIATQPISLPFVTGVLGAMGVATFAATAWFLRAED